LFGHSYIPYLDLAVGLLYEHNHAEHHHYDYDDQKLDKQPAGLLQL